MMKNIGKSVGCHRATLDDASNKKSVNPKKVKKAVDEYIKQREANKK